MEIRACVFDVDHTRRELQAHGTPEFPCAGYETLYTAGPEGDICWHWHEDMELWQVLEGEMELRVPGRALLLRAGGLRRRQPEYAPRRRDAALLPPAGAGIFARIGDGWAGHGVCPPLPAPAQRLRRL